MPENWPMNTLSLKDFLRSFPDARYRTEEQLLTWFPRGTLDDIVADQLTMIIEAAEMNQAVPFNRYTDLSLLTDINLRVGHVFEIAERRREVVQPVRSAFFADTAIGFGIARMYETLMERAIIQVRAFRDRDLAAQWLKVPVELLQPK
jgi:hypothetical protein